MTYEIYSPGFFTELFSFTGYILYIAEKYAKKLKEFKKPGGEVY